MAPGCAPGLCAQLNSMHVTLEKGMRSQAEVVAVDNEEAQHEGISNIIRNFVMTLTLAVFSVLLL